MAAVTYNGASMQRSDDGYWLLTSGGPFSQPAQLSITSVLGDTVIGLPPWHSGDQSHKGSFSVSADIVSSTPPIPL